MKLPSRNPHPGCCDGRAVSGGSEQRSPYSPQFITALNEFEDRTCAALGLEAGSADSDSKPGAADGGGGKKGGGAGSAAAGAGGWLLNRYDVM